MSRRLAVALTCVYLTAILWYTFGTGALLLLLSAAAVLGVLLCISTWTSPRPASDLEALADATREPRLPAGWTRKDWDELEREVRGQ